MESFQFNSTDDVIRVLQITDPHLFADTEDNLLGVPTCHSFQAVLDAVQQQSFASDVVLLTGDLVQDHDASAYHRFAEMVKPLNKPLFWIEGNHDIQPHISEILQEYPHIQPHKHLLLGRYWQAILLDSSVANVPYGELAPTQLQFLQRCLAENPERFSLIVLHHNILPTNSAWLDQHSLKNADKLAEILKPYPNVKAILHGHIHQQVDSVWQGYRILATPSTCIQFKPNSDDFALDLLPQGWRELSLLPNGEIETEVKRLNSNEFLPNMSAKGY